MRKTTSRRQSSRRKWQKGEIGRGGILRCCASSHYPPDTACKSYLVGGNGRCVYCDHEAKCHPGPGATCWIGSGEEQANDTKGDTNATR